MSSQEMSPGVELSVTESWTLLRQAGVGRLALVIDDRPDIFPVNHFVDHDSVVFATALGTKHAGAVGHQVAYEVDGYDPQTASAWSVVVKGDAWRRSACMTCWRWASCRCFRGIRRTGRISSGSSPTRSRGAG